MTGLIDVHDKAATIVKYMLANRLCTDLERHCWQLLAFSGQMPWRCK